MKIMKVKRAFSRIPRMFNPAMAQMIPRTRAIFMGSDKPEKGGGVDHHAHRRDAGGEDIVHHDGGHGHEGDHGAQHQVGKGIDPAADQAVVFQNLGDLRQPGGKKPDKQAGDGNKDDGADRPMNR